MFLPIGTGATAQDPKAVCRDIGSLVSMRTVGPRVRAIAMALLLAACAHRGTDLGQLNVLRDNLPACEVTVCLHARYLGATTVAITDGRSTVLIDGYLSRPPVQKALLFRIEPQHELVAAALQALNLPPVCGVYVAHGHYDHALDAAHVSHLTKAPAYGSAAVGRIFEAQVIRAERRGVPLSNARFAPLRSDDPSQTPPACGSFGVEAVAAPHAHKVRYAGEVSGDFALPAKGSAFRLGKDGLSHSFIVRHASGATIIVHPSANTAPSFVRAGPHSGDPMALYEDVKADVVFLGVAELGNGRAQDLNDYCEAVVGQTGATRVVAIHWDDFGNPLWKALEAYPRIPFVTDNVDKTIETLERDGCAGAPVERWDDRGWRRIG